MRTKGEYYFQDIDITGSISVSRKKNSRKIVYKFPRLDFHVDALVPELEDICRKESQDGVFHIIVRYCYDRAKAHTETKFMEALVFFFEHYG